MDVIPYEEGSFYIFDRAYNDFGRLFTINGVGAYFVVRGRKNNDFRPMRWKRRLPSGVLSDAIGYMDGQLTMSKYPEKIRRIIYLDSESDRKFIFFTNALDINSLKVAELYHNRWQIELSIYEMLQLVSISLTETICLKDLFAKPNCNIVNEPDGSTEPTLF